MQSRMNRQRRTFATGAGGKIFIAVLALFSIISLYCCYLTIIVRASKARRQNQEACCIFENAELGSISRFEVVESSKLGVRKSKFITKIPELACASRHSPEEAPASPMTFPTNINIRSLQPPRHTLHARCQPKSNSARSTDPSSANCLPDPSRKSHHHSKHVFAARSPPRSPGYQLSRQSSICNM